MTCFWFYSWKVLESEVEYKSSGSGPCHKHCATVSELFLICFFEVTQTLHPLPLILESSRTPSSCLCHTRLPCSSSGKEAACSAGNLGSLPGSGRPFGEGKGNPLQCSCLVNPIDREACRAHRLAELDTTEWLTLTYLTLIPSHMSSLLVHHLYLSNTNSWGT